MWPLSLFLLLLASEFVATKGQNPITPRTPRNHRWAIASKVQTSFRGEGYFFWNNSGELGNRALLTPYQFTSVILYSTLSVPQNSTTAAIIELSYFAQTNSSKNLIPKNQFELNARTPLSSAFQLGPCGASVLRGQGNRIWANLLGFGKGHPRDTEVSGVTGRYYEDAEIQIGQPLWIMFTYETAFRLYVVDVPNRLTWNARAFQLKISIERPDRQFTWASTFSQVRLTSKDQCPEHDKTAETGLYQVWPLNQFNESKLSTTLTAQVPTEWEHNSTRLYIGLLLSDPCVNLLKKFSISVSVVPIPLSPHVLPPWAIILTVCVCLIILVIVVVIAVWSRSYTSDYLPLLS